MSADIAGLLARLSAVNEGMAEFASKQSQSAAIHHTLQRHRDILQDYKLVLLFLNDRQLYWKFFFRQEYTKTKSNIESLIEREDLLSSVHKEINEYGKGKKDSINEISLICLNFLKLPGRSGSNKRMDLLLSESESARNSERMIDDQISIAIEARDALANQRAAFKAIQTKLNDISNR